MLRPWCLQRLSAFGRGCPFTAHCRGWSFTAPPSPRGGPLSTPIRGCVTPYDQRRGPIPPPAISATAAYSTSASVSPGGDTVARAGRCLHCLSKPSSTIRCTAAIGRTNTVIAGRMARRSLTPGPSQDVRRRGDRDGPVGEPQAACPLDSEALAAANLTAPPKSPTPSRTTGPAAALADIAGARIDVRAPTRLVAVSTRDFARCHGVLAALVSPRRLQPPARRKRRPSDTRPAARASIGVVAQPDS